MQVGLFHFLNDITGVGFGPLDDGEYAKLQDAFPHLALGVLDVHTSFNFLVHKICLADQLRIIYR